MKLISRSLSVLTLLALTACGGEDGAPGPAGANGANGEPGKPGDPAAPSNDPSSVSLVTPSKGIRDREVEVQIGGSKTKFADGAKPDFGPDIEVVEIKAASPTLLVAKLKISATAKLGPRTVKVGDIEAKNAFDVISSVKFGATGTAKVDQGGGVIVAIENNDTTAFDANAFALVSDQFLDLGTSASNGQAGTLALLAPPLVTVGKAGLTFANLDAEGKPRVKFSTADDAIEVVSRSASALAFGTPKNNENIGKQLATSLYKIATPANENAVVELNFHVEEGSPVLSTVLWGAGGKVGDVVGRASAVVNGIFGPEPKEAPYDVTFVIPVTQAASKDMFLTALNLGADAGKFDVSATKATATVLNEAAAPHSDDLTAQTLTLAASGAANFVKGAIATTEQDWYKITVEEGDIVSVGVESAAAFWGVIVDSEISEVSDYATSAPKAISGARTTNLTAGEYFVVVGRDAAGAQGPYTIALKRTAAPN